MSFEDFRQIFPGYYFTNKSKTFRFGERDGDSIVHDCVKKIPEYLYLQVCLFSLLAFCSNSLRYNFSIKHLCFLVLENPWFNF